jgi:hypothetical protein
MRERLRLRLKKKQGDPPSSSSLQNEQKVTALDDSGGGSSGVKSTSRSVCSSGSSSSTTTSERQNTNGVGASDDVDELLKFINGDVTQESKMSRKAAKRARQKQRKAAEKNANTHGPASGSSLWQDRIIEKCSSDPAASSSGTVLASTLESSGNTSASSSVSSVDQPAQKKKAATTAGPGEMNPTVVPASSGTKSADGCHKDKTRTKAMIVANNSTNSIGQPKTFTDMQKETQCGAKQSAVTQNGLCNAEVHSLSRGLNGSEKTNAAKAKVAAAAVQETQECCERKGHVSAENGTLSQAVVCISPTSSVVSSSSESPRSVSKMTKNKQPRKTEVPPVLSAQHSAPVVKSQGKCIPTNGIQSAIEYAKSKRLNPDIACQLLSPGSPSASASHQNGGMSIPRKDSPFTNGYSSSQGNPDKAKTATAKMSSSMRVCPKSTVVSAEQKLTCRSLELKPNDGGACQKTSCPVQNGVVLPLQPAAQLSSRTGSQRVSTSSVSTVPNGMMTPCKQQQQFPGDPITDCKAVSNGMHPSAQTNGCCNILAAGSTKGKKSRRKGKGKGELSSVDEIFLPKENIEQGHLDEFEREIEEFKRFCFNSTMSDSREKLQVNMNLKDIFAKKKGVGNGCT